MHYPASPDLPPLTPANHQVTSPADLGYNCIAWAAGDTRNWWQPDVYWPVEVDPDAESVEDLIRAYEAVGYRRCDADAVDSRAELVAVYGDDRGRYTHAARRLPNGRWTSKLGAAVDIEHDTPDDVAGGLYGNVVGFLARPVTTSAPAVS